MLQTVRKTFLETGADVDKKGGVGLEDPTGLQSFDHKGAKWRPQPGVVCF